jgi:uncharacterized membrane protein
MRAWAARLTDMVTYVRTVPLIYVLPAIALAILLQIQISLFRHEGYLGLRINAADLILPLLGILVFRPPRLQERPASSLAYSGILHLDIGLKRPDDLRPVQRL